MVRLALGGDGVVTHIRAEQNGRYTAMMLYQSAPLVGAVLTPVAGLTALWLRLRWRTRQEHARRHTLVALARSLRPGSQLEEHCADGTSLRVTVAASDKPGHGRSAMTRIEGPR